MDAKDNTMAKVETERYFGKKGIIIMIRDGNKMVSAIFKDKKNADKFNRNKPADVKKLLQLAKKTKYPKAIDESLNENFPNMKKWWKEDKKEVMSFIYYLQGQLPPNNKDKYKKAWVSIAKQLQKKTPAPTNIYKKIVGESLDEGKKRYNVMYGVGSSKYTVNFHNGKSKHKDGSDFFDIAIFKNKRDLAKKINDLTKQGYIYSYQEGVNEGSKEALGIAKLTGARGVAIDDFIKKHNIDAKKLFNYVKKGNLQDRLGFITALVGKPNNKFFKMVIGRFAESVNEVLVIVDKFDKRKQDYGKVYYQDGGKRPGDGDLKKAKKELEKLSKKHKGLTLISVGRNSKMYDVMDESVNEAYLVAYGKGPKPMKPAFAAYADKKMAQKFMADMKKDGYKVMMTQKKIRGIDENKSEISKIYKQAGKKEIKFYDILSNLEKKLGKNKYRAFLVKSLKDFKINGNHYDYRTNAAAEEKLFQLAK